jgi:hypothetical protein
MADLKKATAKDIKGERQLFFREGEDFKPLTIMRPEDYPNFKWIKEGKDLFIESCRNDWNWKVNKAKQLLKNKNLFTIKQSNQ